MTADEEVMTAGEEVMTAGEEAAAEIKMRPKRGSQIERDLGNLRN